MHVRERRTFRERRVLNRCKELMRFETENIDFLSAEFLPQSDETRGKALSARQRMEIFLRYTADPGFQSGVAEDIGVDRSTVCKNINYVMGCILEKVDNWIHFPSTVQEINNAKVMWQTHFSLPTVLGALDCTHIEINKPSMFGDEYINRKGYASINVQATCDAGERFTSISAEWPGSVHDSRIWRRSDVRNIISRYDGSACLLGDSGYGLAPWLITPFKTPQQDIQRRFNHIHAKERVIIERVFGQLKKRFPILANCVRVSLERVPKLVLCCAVLHNVAKHLKDPLNFEEMGEDGDEDDFVNEEGGEEIYENVATRQRGERKRNDMLRFI